MYGVPRPQSDGYRWSGRFGHRRRPLQLMPVMMVPAPIRSAVEPMSAVIPISRPIIAVAWSEENAEPNRRKIKGGTRWRRWRVIVTWRRCAVRLNHIRAGIRAQNRSERECEHRQPHYETFLSHIEEFLLLFRDLTRLSRRSCSPITTRTQAGKTRHIRYGEKAVCLEVAFRRRAGVISSPTTGGIFRSLCLSSVRSARNVRRQSKSRSAGR